jgi:hypothetical protein
VRVEYELLEKYPERNEAAVHRDSQHYSQKQSIRAPVRGHLTTTGAFWNYRLQPRVSCQTHEIFGVESHLYGTVTTGKTSVHFASWIHLVGRRLCLLLAECECGGPVEEPAMR